MYLSLEETKNLESFGYKHEGIYRGISQYDYYWYNGAVWAVGGHSTFSEDKTLAVDADVYLKGKKLIDTSELNGWLSRRAYYTLRKNLRDIHLTINSVDEMEHFFEAKTSSLKEAFCEAVKHLLLFNQKLAEPRIIHLEDDIWV